MKYFLVTVFFLLLPQIVHADVRITEVAWMGTEESQYSEWFELYNDGPESVDLSGWKLYEAGTTLVFTLSKSIEAGGYLLIERTTTSAPDAVPGVNDESGSFGGGGFANSGEDLTLKDSTGTIVDSLDYVSGWPAGDAASKQTMQWDGTSWVTAASTPDAQTGESNGSASKTIPKEPIDPNPLPKVSPNQPHVEFVVPTTVYRGVPYQYEAQPVYEYNYRIHKGSFRWNMGDGTIVQYDDATPVIHTYEYSGTYTISFLYTDPTNDQLPLRATKKITVAVPAVTIAIVDGAALQIKNTSSTPVDLSGWSVGVAGRSLTIPDMTIIAEKSTATIPFNAFGIAHVASLALTDPAGAVVARTGDLEVAPISSSAHSSQETTSRDTPIYTPPDLVEDVPPIDVVDTNPPVRKHTKTIVFGVVALFVIGLSILLERVMAQQEYLEEESL